MAIRLIGLKRAIAAVLQSYPIGMAIGWLYDDVIPFHGMRIDVRGAAMRPANKAALRFGMYESAEYRFVESFLRADLPVIELGSSIGAVSSAIAGRLAPGQSLTCVEANPALIPVLEGNLSRNASHLAVKVVHAAVAYGGTHVCFQVSANNLASSLAVNDDQGDVVPSVTLAALREPHATMPFQLVADIEGAEVEILLRDVEALRSCQVMIMELHESHRGGEVVSTIVLKNLINAAGFEIVAEYGAVVVCQRNEYRHLQVTT
jgi:FkbM family methyltransferase